LKKALLAGLNLTLSLTFSAGLFGLTATPAHAEKRTLVLSAYPIAQPLFTKYVYTPFKEKCGCEIVVETGNNADRIAKLDGAATIRWSTWCCCRTSACWKPRARA
jgi:putative spermidine/putrescine transport system substrate-binding protein